MFKLNIISSTSSIIFYALAFIFAMVVPIRLFIQFSLSEFIIMDMDDITPREAISLSSKMMEGYKSEFAKLWLSFFGWYLLLGIVASILLLYSVLSLGVPALAAIGIYGIGFIIISIPIFISLIWVLPYAFVTFANFYEKRKEKFIDRNPNYLKEKERHNSGIILALISFAILSCIVFVLAGSTNNDMKTIISFADRSEASNIYGAISRTIADDSLVVYSSGTEVKVRANDTSFIINGYNLVNDRYLRKVPDIKQFDTPNRGWRVKVSGVDEVTIEILNDINNPTKVIQVYPATE